MKQFERLLRVVRERGGDGPRMGRPWCLPLADRVLVVAVYYRTNLTMRQLAPLFGVQPATVCRVIQRLRPLLALEPASRAVDAADRLREKSLRAFGFDANPNVDPATVNTLATCEWVKKGEPLCLIGDSGTGKSHLLIALGTEAAMQGFRVRYVLATKLVNELVEAADEKQLSKTIARYGRVDLLCIDELGYMELDRRGAELLFHMLTEREEKNSVAIASNESFSGWTKTFTDPRLCAAIVDRLTFNGAIIQTGTESYRLAHTKAQAQQAAAG